MLIAYVIFLLAAVVNCLINVYFKNISAAIAWGCVALLLLKLIIKEKKVESQDIS
jgi:hypothetical protein